MSLDRMTMKTLYDEYGLDTTTQVSNSIILGIILSLIKNHL